MKKILLGIVALVVVVVVAVGGYAAHLVGKLNSPEFQEQVRAEVSRQMGAEVRLEEMDIALASGLTLRGVAVANPAPFEGDLFTARSFVLRYKLMPLLSGRVEVEQLALENPVLGLIVDEDGRFNYEALGGEARTGASPATGAEGAEPGGAAPTDTAAETGASSSPLDIVLSEVKVTDAHVTMLDEENVNLMTVEDADFTAALKVSGGTTQGQAQASIATVSMVDMLFVRDIGAPLTVSTEEVQLSPIQGKVAGGIATGALTAHMKDAFRYEGNLDLNGVSVKTLLQEAQVAAVRVSGTLQGAMTFEGTGPMSTLKANGNAEVVDCRIEDSKMLALLATILKVPELASPEFQECRVEYSLARNVVSTPVLSLKGRAMEVTGKGTLNLIDSTLDYDLELALAEALLEKIPIQELRAAFKPREDGLSVVAFRAYGTTEAPQTDLMSRVGKAAATEAAKDQVNKLLKKVF